MRKKEGKKKKKVQVKGYVADGAQLKYRRLARGLRTNCSTPRGWASRHDRRGRLNGQASISFLVEARTIGIQCKARWILNGVESQLWSQMVFKISSFMEKWRDILGLRRVTGIGNSVERVILLRSCHLQIYNTYGTCKLNLRLLLKNARPLTH